MKIKQKLGNTTHNAIKTVKQTIAKDKIASAVFMLRDKIYTDKLKAAVQETICNAVDEHRKHNVDKPVTIIVTHDEICIRDFAKGLDQDGVLNTFFQFFASTKDHSNDAIGGFGIGAKAPGAYTDIWTVESWYGGMHSVYTSVTEEQESSASLVFEEPCSPEETGIMVRIPTDQHDKVLSCAKSIAAMIGFYEEKCPVRIFVTSILPLLEDVLEHLPNKRIQDLLDGYIGDDNKVQVCGETGLYEQPVTRLRDKLLNSNWGIAGKMYAIPTWVLTECVEYSFWRSGDIWLYDGDILYKAAYDVERAINDITDSRLSGYGTAMIVMFERGQVNVSPSRETVEQDAHALKLAAEAGKECLQFIEERAVQLIDADFKSAVAAARYYRTGSNSYMRGGSDPFALRVKSLLSTYTFYHDKIYRVKEAKDAEDGFRITNLKEKHTSLWELTEDVCLIDASDTGLNSIASPLRKWVAANGGANCKYKRFVAIEDKNMLQRTITACTYGDKKLLKYGVNIFKASDFGIESVERKENNTASRKPTKRKLAPIKVYYHGTDTLIPEKEYATTLALESTMYYRNARIIDHDFYKFMGYTGVTVVPAHRLPLLVSRGIVKFDYTEYHYSKHNQDDKQEALKEIGSVIDYIKKHKLIAANGSCDPVLRITKLPILSTSWGYGILSSYTSYFLSELAQRFENALQDLLVNELTGVDFLVTKFITMGLDGYGRTGPFDEKHMAKVSNHLVAKYSKILKSLIETIDYDKFITDACTNITRKHNLS